MAGLFNPRNFVEEFERPAHPPKCESGEIKADIIDAGYFSIPITLIEAIPAFHLTPSDVTYLLFLLSRFNLNRGEFCMSDYEVGYILHINPKTVQRARRKLKGGGWLEAREGGIIQGEFGPEYRRTKYLELICPGFNKGAPTPPYLPLQRSTFAFLLNGLAKGRIKQRHIVAYIAICYFEWRARRDWGTRCSEFSIAKSALRGLFGKQDTPELVLELSQVLLPDGEPFYGVTDNHQSFRIAGLRDCPAAEKRLEQRGQKTLH